ncbi:MAG: hypothetical protein CMM94_04995 [Rickettsiales bacterium]|nr:hypothetical protein [Rickettsiales bacterium]
MTTAISEEMRDRIVSAHPNNEELRGMVNILEATQLENLNAVQQTMMYGAVDAVHKILLVPALQEMQASLGEVKDIGGTRVRETGDGVARPDFGGKINVPEGETAAQTLLSDFGNMTDERFAQAGLQAPTQARRFGGVER